MDSFDLNIQNYTIKELKGLLSLSDVYDTYDVNSKKENICKRVSNDNTLTIDMKIKMNNFIEVVSKILLNLIESSSSSSSSSSNALVKKDSKSKSDENDKKLTFDELKNSMQKWSNDTIIEDPFSANNIVGKEDKPGSSFSSYGTIKGMINPLLKNTILRGVNIDSRYRDDYYDTTSTNISITLPFRLENVISYRLVSVSLPVTYYNISQRYGNNVIRIDTYKSFGGPPATGFQLVNTFDLILQDGIYNTTQNSSQFSTPIETEINNILNSNPNSPNVVLVASGYDNPMLLYTINRVNGKSIFAQDVSANSPYYFKIITNVGLNVTSGNVNVDYDVNKGIITRLGWILGFRVSVIYSSNWDGNASKPPPNPEIFGSLISSSICFTKYPIYGFLAVDDFQNNVVDYYKSVFSESISIPNIISRIDLTRLIESAGAFQAAQGQSSSTSINTERKFFGPVTIQKLKITLYDDLGYVLDLNGMDWAVEFAFECVYNM
jgi:hypothetical protein